MNDERARQMRQYLLGVLDEAEQDRLELDLLGDRQVVEELDDVEDALVEDYLAHALTASEAERFERHYASSPEHRQRVETARFLKDGVAHAATRRPARTHAPAPHGWKLAAALGAIGVASALWLMRGPEPAGLHVAVRPAVPAVTASPRSPEARIATLTLSPGRLMAGGATTPRVSLTPPLKALRLELLVEDVKLGRCAATLRSDTKGEIWGAAGLAPERMEGGAALTVEVPVDRLAPGPYTLVLAEEVSGRPAATYDFEVQP